MNTDKEKLTPYVVEVVEERRCKVVVYGSDYIDALSTTRHLCDDETICVNGAPSRQYLLKGQATEDDMKNCSGIFDRSSDVHIPPVDTNYLTRAKALIFLFCSHEYKEENLSFSDLENVGLASTDYEESDHGSYTVTVTADLIHFKIRTFINDVLVSTVECDSLRELCDEHLEYLDFDGLVYITDEEWSRYYDAVAVNNRKRVNELRAEYPKGTRIRLIKTVNDPQPIGPGSIGTVRHVDGIGQLHLDWECHRSLALIPGADLFEVISRPQ